MTRDVAHIVIEAITPLKVGSSVSDFIQDSPVQKDFNDLPMILGTSITGVLRKAFDTEQAEDFFGKSNGSKVIISNALLLDENLKVTETLLLEKSPFLRLFETLPLREHTAISNKGVAKEHSKFDEELVYSGTQFKFSIESIEKDNSHFLEILNHLSAPSFRLGGGSSKGFGAFRIVSINTQRFNLTSYENYSSSLNFVLSTNTYTPKKLSSNYDTYTLYLKPDDFFMFGSGFSDSDADMTPVYEKCIDYDTKCLSDKKVLIPASSIKGAIAHRTTFHYNANNKLYTGNEEAKESIEAIFGEAKNSKKEIVGSKGKLLMSDCYINDADTKVFDHVCIDRFTGGGLDGALFQEKTVTTDESFSIEILLEKNIDDIYVKAFEMSLKDITTGMLSLGGMSTKGHGVFSGSVAKNGEAL